MKPTAYLHAIATATPDSVIEQHAALDFMLRHLSLNEGQRAFLRRIYTSSGIERRHSAVPDFCREPDQFTFFPPNEGLRPQPLTGARNALFVTASNALAAAAVKDVLERAGMDADCITHLVTASCTGFSAPGFDCHIIQSLGMRPDIQRFHLGFMGCFAAFPAMRLAAHICGSTPGARVVVVPVELCTLHFTDDLDAETLVTQSLFSDGAAALLVSADPRDTPRPLYALRHFATRLLPASADEMTWRIGDHGFEMGLTAEVPHLIERTIRDVLEAECRAAGVTPADIRHWAIHPGGRAILDKAADALALPRDRFDASYRVLREHGNMSAATVLFVLDVLSRESEPGPVFGAAFGPGLTVESALLDKL